MVGVDAVDDVLAFLKLLCEVYADGDVRAFDFMVDGFADIVEKSSALGERYVATELGRH